MMSCGLIREETIMKLEEVRGIIDAIDPQIRKLIMERLDCSYKVAEAKKESGDITIYRADREEEILKRLGEDVPPERKAGYLAVVRKIMETSRMYQYGLLFDWLDGIFEPLAKGIEIYPNGSRVRVLIERPNRPNAMSSILSMIGDYGYNMEKMELIRDDAEKNTVTFELTIIGNLSESSMQKLMFQLSMESLSFKILENRRTKIYLAGPFFEQHETEMVLKAENILRGRGFEVFSPREYEPRDEAGSRAWSEKIFAMDRANIDECDCVVMLYYGANSDTGTAWECGYAYAAGKPVIVVHLSEVSNLMVHEGSWANVSFDELETYDFSRMPAKKYQGKMI